MVLQLVSIFFFFIASNSCSNGIYLSLIFSKSSRRFLIKSSYYKMHSLLSVKITVNSPNSSSFSLLKLEKSSSNYKNRSTSKKAKLIFICNIAFFVFIFITFKFLFVLKFLSNTAFRKDNGLFPFI